MKAIFAKCESSVVETIYHRSENLKFVSLGCSSVKSFLAREINHHFFTILPWALLCENLSNSFFSSSGYTAFRPRTLLLLRFCFRIFSSFFTQLCGTKLSAIYFYRVRGTTELQKA